MRHNESGYEKLNKRQHTLYNIQWPAYIAGEKFNILKKLTEMTGIYILFYVNQYKRLIPFVLGAAWYSGLRPSVLKYWNPSSIDPIPPHIIEIIDNKKIYLKYLEIYSLDDELNILYQLRRHYKEAYFDTNGLQEPENIDLVKIVDKTTKTYYKDNQAGLI